MSPDLIENVVMTAGWVAIHSLWQGLLVTGLLLVARRVLYYRPANLRYLTGCIALGLVAAFVLSTAVVVYTRHQSEAVTTGPSLKDPTVRNSFAPKVPQDAIASDQPVRVSIPHLPPLSYGDRVILIAEPWLPSLPALVTIWSVGITFVILLQLAGAAVAFRIVGSATPVPPERIERFRQLCEALNAPPSTQFLVSSHRGFRTPFTLGWRKPIVLVPSCVASRLSDAAIDSLVAHELAHVRRSDYVANVFQTTFETVLFFNPCVWWISKVVRDEREMCCDTMVAAECDQKVYANALAALADITPKPTAPPHSLSAVGGAFLERIQALAGTRAAGSCLSVAVLCICLVCASAVGVGAVAKTVEVRTMSDAGRSHESTVVFQEIKVPRRDEGFATTLGTALRAVRAGTITPETLSEVVSAFDRGVDPDLIWRDFERIRRNGYYPTIVSEFPNDWPWAESGDQRQLARLIWKQAKRMPAGAQRRSVGRAALGVAAMRRETTSIAIVKQIVTDARFSEVCEYDAQTVARLRQYASASSDLIGRAAVALRREAGGQPVPFLGRLLAFDQQAMNLCRSRLPELDFIDRELRITDFHIASHADQAVVFSFFNQPVSRQPRRTPQTGAELSLTAAAQEQKP